MMESVTNYHQYHNTWQVLQEYWRINNLSHKAEIRNEPMWYKKKK